MAQGMCAVQDLNVPDERRDDNVLRNFTRTSLHHEYDFV